MSTAERLLGEYRLIKPISEAPISRTWLAEQVSVSRSVLVDELRKDMLDRKPDFLADVRAKASVDHPLIGSVFEAVDDGDLCFFAHELLPGATLEARKSPVAPFEPAKLAHILNRVAQAHLQHESSKQPTAPLELRHIHVDEHGVVRIANLAIAGDYHPEQSVRDITRLGHELPTLVADGKPGATRLLTLLGWMRGDGLDAPITWSQVREFCIQIEQQLAEPLPTRDATRSAAQNKRRNPPPVAVVAVAGAIALAVIIGLAVKFRPTPPTGPLKINLPDSLLVPAGPHPTPDGTVEHLSAFRIAPHEVTIGQYASFLDTLDTLAANQLQATFDHEDQPAGKSNHQPDDWQTLLAAAKSGGTWNHRHVSLDSPVVGIDWWDAAAYAEWKKGRLPTQEEWYAALRLGGTNPATIKPSDWIPVTNPSDDRTPKALLGMAGSVAEWTLDRATNPSNPLGAKNWVVIGGSYLRPGSNALSREWVEHRDLRRPDLGFRIVNDPS